MQALNFNAEIKFIFERVPNNANLDDPLEKTNLAEEFPCKIRDLEIKINDLPPLPPLKFVESSNETNEEANTNENEKKRRKKHRKNKKSKDSFKMNDDIN